MREPGHHGRRVLQCARRQRVLIRRERSIDVVQHVTDIKPEIGRNLIVARARGMEPPGGGADDLGQPALNVHMDVFKRPLECEFAAFDL